MSEVRMGSLQKKLLMSLLSIVLIMVLVVPVSANQSGLGIQAQVTGDIAYGHVEYLSEVIGARVAATAKERETAQYIVEQFEALGYEVEVQPFSYVRQGQTFNSENVIARRPGKRKENIIVGAHYDSVSSRVKNGQTLTGAGDNASGVGVMLEAAAVLAGMKTQANITFIAFGAEEVGLRGSRYYAAQMTPEEVDNTLAMINLDCVGIGDFFYVYAARHNNPGWVRDLALEIGLGMGHDIRTSPQSQYYAYGTTGDWSDHVPFKDLGIPIAYFEWMNWDIYPNGGLETAEHGMVMHTGYDNLSFISQDKLMQTAQVVTTMVFEMAKNPSWVRSEHRTKRVQRFSEFQERIQ